MFAGVKSILSQIEQRVRFAPIRNLTPEKLVRMLDAFEQGFLAEGGFEAETAGCVRGDEPGKDFALGTTSEFKREEREGRKDLREG
jgi:hypothetical protein